VGIIEPLQTTPLVVIPGMSLSEFLPLAIVLARITAYFEHIILSGHTERDLETTAQQHRIILAERLHVVEAEETAIEHNGLMLELRRVVGQQVIEGLIDVADGIFQEIIVLDTLIYK
jgi:hypothetical protein